MKVVNSKSYRRLVLVYRTEVRKVSKGIAENIQSTRALIGNKMNKDLFQKTHVPFYKTEIYFAVYVVISNENKIPKYLIQI